MTPITEADVRDLIVRWFDAVRLKKSLAEQRRLFAPGVKIETWAGITLPLETQIAIHERLTDRPGEKRILAECGEDWIIERDADGELRFARYLTSSMRYLPGSAKLDLG